MKRSAAEVRDYIERRYAERVAEAAPLVRAMRAKLPEAAEVLRSRFGAIRIFLFGSFGKTESRILLTVAAISGYSLLGLAATTALGQKPGWLGPVGLGVSAIGFVLAVTLIWINVEGTFLGRLTGSVLVLAVALAHGAQLRRLTQRFSGGPVAVVRRVTSRSLRSSGRNMPAPC